MSNIYFSPSPSSALATEHHRYEIFSSLPCAVHRLAKARLDARRHDVCHDDTQCTASFSYLPIGAGCDARRHNAHHDLGLHTALSQFGQCYAGTQEIHVTRRHDDAHACIPLTSPKRGLQHTRPAPFFQYPEVARYFQQQDLEPHSNMGVSYLI